MEPKRTFGGFQAGKIGKVIIPDPFFSDLLPLIDDLAELKLTVYCFWALQQREGEYRYLRLRDLVADQVLLDGLGDSPEAALNHALECAVRRGTLLVMAVPGLSGDDELLYFMNTDKGRCAVEALERGDWAPGGEDRPVGLIADRPNIFKLYEQNIGPLTPLIAETLRDAEHTYPYEWIDEAMRIAIEGNKRNWRYIEAILKRWATEGKSAPRQQPSQEPNRYLQDAYFQRRRRSGDTGDGGDSES